MDITQMQYIVKVAEEKNISRAAERLHITQPALSRSIARIEASLGCAVFTKDGKQTMLTSQGKLVYEFCLKTIENYNALRHSIHPRSIIQNKQSISIACSGYIFSRKIVLGFQKKHPEYRLNDKEFSKSEYPDIINQVDGVLSVKGFSSIDYQSFLVYRSPLFVAVPSNHPIAAKSSVLLEEISDEHFIVVNDNNLFYDHVHDMFHHIRKHMLISSSVEKTHMIDMLRDGMGLSIVSAETVALLQGFPSVVSVPITDDYSYMDVYFAWRIQPEYSDAFNAFRSYINHYKPEELSVN